MNLSLLILSCDKNHDLCKWLNETSNLFLKQGVDCTLVTENDDSGFLKTINVIKCGDKQFDERFVIGLHQCEHKYVMVLLDDYYVHDDNLEAKINNWLSILEKDNIDALRVSKCKKWFVKKRKIQDKYYELKSIKPYEIDFHPTIWKKSTLLSLIENRKFTPWTLEPLLSLFLKDKKGVISKEIIEYDELIIQGCFFKKPFKLYCKDDYVGNKQIIKAKKYFVYSIKVFVFNVSPYWLIRILRKLFKTYSFSAEAKLEIDN